jgi:hypothetical protein
MKIGGHPWARATLGKGHIRGKMCPINENNGAAQNNLFIEQPGPDALESLNDEDNPALECLA